MAARPPHLGARDPALSRAVSAIAATARTGWHARCSACRPVELRPMLALLPETLPAPSRCPRSIPPKARAGARVALLAGCVQQALDPDINWATLRVLAKQRRRGRDPAGAGLLRRAAHAPGRAGPRPACRPVPTWESSRRMWMRSSPTRPAAGRGCTSTRCSSPACRRRRPRGASPACGEDVTVFLAEARD